MDNDNNCIRFLCIDCKTEVYVFGHCTQTKRCATCDWIVHNIKLTNKEKQELRTILGVELERLSR
jgi:ferredoxin